MHKYENQSSSHNYEAKKLSLAYFHRGNAYYLKGVYEKALADFDKFIHLDPPYRAVKHYPAMTLTHLPKIQPFFPFLFNGLLFLIGLQFNSSTP